LKDKFVYTKSSLKLLEQIVRCIECNEPVLLSGETGVGKSVIARVLLLDLQEKSNNVAAFVNFSAQTSSKRTQEMIEAKLEKRRKNVLGAPKNKNIIVFIDDLNMPKKEEYGAQPPIELIR
jgi:dynein heavy chain